MLKVDVKKIFLWSFIALALFFLNYFKLSYAKTNSSSHKKHIEQVEVGIYFPKKTNPSDKQEYKIVSGKELEDLKADFKKEQQESTTQIPKNN
jgi:hypothetical protein